MKRILSGIDHTQPIERADSGLPLSLHDCEIRSRCRNAPLFVRRNIDARRAARGLPPLWGSDAEANRVRRLAAIRRLKAFIEAQRASS